MKDEDCVAFLQWALPQLRMRWSGFRKVRGQVCKRLQRRINALSLEGISNYRDYLRQNREEWLILDELSRVSISRFYRDKQMFTLLEQEVLPTLAQQAMSCGDRCLKVWSVGCSSGEEPYTVSLLWRLRLQSQFPEIGLHILASDADSNMIRRAKAAAYRYSTIKNLPQPWRDEGFIQNGEYFFLKMEYQQDVLFSVDDVRKHLPEERFHLVLCRNLVFTYYEEALQRELLEQLKGVIVEKGGLVLGVHETLPEHTSGFEPWSERLSVYRKKSDAPY